MKLARFKTSDDAEVYVNADLVTFVRQYHDENEDTTTTIYFSDKHSVTVDMKVSAVASALAGAGKL